MSKNLPEIIDEDLSEFDAPKNKIDVDKALSLKIDHGLSYTDLGQYFGVSKQIIHYYLKDLVPDTSNVKSFRKYRGDLLDVKQETILKSLTPDDIKGATPYQRVGMFGILYDKSRLEHDKSTGNISYVDHTQEYNEASSKRRELLDQLGLDDDVDLDSL